LASKICCALICEWHPIVSRMRNKITKCSYAFVS
jgi:hypothetical protein